MRLHFFVPSVLALLWLAFSATHAAPGIQSPTAGCTVLTGPGLIPQPTLVHFDDQPSGQSVIGEQYRSSHGVYFEDIATTRVIYYGNEPEDAHSPPNVASNDAVSPNTSGGVAMNFWFTSPKTHVGFWLSNGHPDKEDAIVTFYDAKNNIICQANAGPPPLEGTAYFGLVDASGQTMRVSIDYGQTIYSEAIDDLEFAYDSQSVGTATATHTASPTNTPTGTGTPTSTPTSSPTATATSTATGTHTPTATQTPPPCTSEVTVIADGDLWTDSLQPTALHSRETTLVARFNSQSDRTRIYLHFPLGAFVPANAPVRSARLELTVAAFGQQSAQTSLFSAATPFSESETTYANQPNPSAFYGAANPNSPVLHSWDVSALVGDWLRGTPNRGLIVAPTGPSGLLAEYHSRESTMAGLRPRLVIDCSPDTPTPTRTPTATPTSTATFTPTPDTTPEGVALPVNPVVVITPFTAVNTDLSLFGVEMTQGIQCFDTSAGLANCPDNSLPLVADKIAAARVYVRYNHPISLATNNIPIAVHYRIGGAGNPWHTANATGSARRTLDQSDAANSINVLFNITAQGQAERTLDLYVEVDPNSQIGETNENNNRWPAQGHVTFRFQRRDTVEIVGQRIRYYAQYDPRTPTPAAPTPTVTPQLAGGWAVNGGAALWYNRMLPLRLNGIDYSVASGFRNFLFILSGNSGNAPCGSTTVGRCKDGEAQHLLIQALNTQWLLQNALNFFGLNTGAYTGADQVYGWVRGYGGGHADMPRYPHAGGLGVVGIGTDSTPDNPTLNAPGRGAYIFGHELIHNYDVMHTDTGADDCGSNDSNSNFPYADSSIQEFGFDPVTSKVYDPANTHDVMSYCPSGGSKEGWLSPFTWQALFNRFAPAARLARVAAGRDEVLRAHQGTDGSLVVNLLVVRPEAGEVESGLLLDSYRVEGNPLFTLPDGDYRVELRQGANVLAEERFAIDFASEYQEGAGHSHAAETPHSHSAEPDPTLPAEPNRAALISFVLPWHGDADRLALLHGDALLDEIVVSANPPSLRITEQSGLRRDRDSVYRVQWEATDLDGDSLRYTVFYSNDGGREWVLLQDGLTENFFDVEVDGLAGGEQIAFRVLATDGIHTGSFEKVVDLQVPNRSPQATILYPQPGDHFPPGRALVLSGGASDQEDGTIPDAGLRWSSDRQGDLGSGGSLPLAHLEPGSHLLTLRAIDKNGATADASVGIVIGNHELFLPAVQR